MVSGQAPVPALGRASHRCPHMAGSGDIDNIAFGMKAFVDGMVDAEAVQDDTPDRVLYGDHTFTRKPKTSRTVVEIEVL